MRVRTGFRLVVLAAVCGLGGAVAQLGCGAILGLEDTTLRDGEGGAQGPDDGQASGPLVVQLTQGWVDADGGYTRTAPMSGRRFRSETSAGPLEPRQVEVLVRTDAGLAGPFYPSPTTSSDGLRFEVLPDGERYVQLYDHEIASKVYIVHGNHIDMGSDDFGRSDAAMTAAGTTVHIAPYKPTDAGVSDDRLSGSANVILHDAGRSAWNATFESGDPLLDLTRGDVAWVTRKAMDLSASNFEVCGFLPDYRMNSGGGPDVVIPCTTVTTQHLALTANPSDFSSAVPTNHALPHVAASIDVAPGAGAFDLTADDVANNLDTSAKPLQIDLRNPAPASWSLLARVNAQFAGTSTLSDGGSTVGGTMSVTTNVVSGTAITVRPMLGAVRGVTIGGKDVLNHGFLSALGPEPIVVAVTPAVADPSLVAPTSYQIDVAEDGYEDKNSAAYSTVSRIVSNNPEVALPPGLLTKGHEYHLEVTARFATHYSEEEPRRGGVPSSSITTITNRFTP